MESLNALHVNRSAIDLQKLYGGGIAGRNPQEVVKMKEKHLTVVIKLGILVKTQKDNMEGQ